MLRTESLTSSGAEPFLTFWSVTAASAGHNLKALCAIAREYALDNIYTLTNEDAWAFEKLVEVNEFHQLRYVGTRFKTFPLWVLLRLWQYGSIRQSLQRWASESSYF